jgi:photosystem II stability/assembly factor-like uncharacterized protein
MDLVIGTSDGLFVTTRGGAPEPAVELKGRSVRHVSRVDGALYAGTDQGLFRSRDGGGSWQPCGLERRVVWDLAVLPDDPRAGGAAVSGRSLLASTQPASVFRSDDGGHAWRELDAFRSVPGAEKWWVPFTPPEPACARSIALDPGDASRWYVGVEVGGLLRTEDAGATWAVELPGCPPEVPVNPDLHTVVVHPASRVLYATTGYGRIDLSEPRDRRSAGVFASADGGRTWRYLWQGIQPRYVRPMCLDPRPPHALTVGASPLTSSSSRDPGGAQAMLYRSDDGGASWRSLGDEAHSPSAGNFLAIAVDPERAGGVLVGTDPGEVWRVTPAGEWTLLADGLPEVHAIAVR